MTTLATITAVKPMVRHPSDHISKDVPASERPTVFVVDHDAAVQDAIAVSLTAAGFDVQTFESADQFLRDLPRRQPGCVLAALDLQGMGGTALAERLHQQDCQLPVVIMSARLRNSRVKRRLPDGVTALLEMPFGLAELIDLIDEALDRQAAIGRTP